MGPRQWLRAHGKFKVENRQSKQTVALHGAGCRILDASCLKCAATGSSNCRRPSRKPVVKPMAFGPETESLLPLLIQISPWRGFPAGDQNLQGGRAGRKALKRVLRARRHLQDTSVLSAPGCAMRSMAATATSPPHASLNPAVTVCKGKKAPL